MIREAAIGLALGCLTILVVSFIVLTINHGPPTIVFSTSTPIVIEITPIPVTPPVYVSTISALETQVVEAEATVDARGARMNRQRTQIAELKEQIPTNTPIPWSP